MKGLNLVEGVEEVEGNESLQFKVDSLGLRGLRGLRGLSGLKDVS